MSSPDRPPHRRRLVWGALLAVLVVATGVGAWILLSGGNRPPPNVVLVMLDDLGVADLGAYGGRLAPTPHLDALAADGLRFTNAYASGPVCSPTRAALLTGRHPVSFGIRRAIVNESVRGIPDGVATLPAVLRDAGYATGHFGKWHLGWNRPDYLPSAKGYDEAVLVASDPPDYDDPAFLVDGTDPIGGEGHLTAATVDFAIDFIRRHRDGPFFVNVWLNAPHTPLDPPAEWAARFPDDREGRYAALIADADEEIGRLVDAIDDIGIAGDTIVIVTSDNGGTHPEFGSNGDYRGDKTSLFEGALRVPMIVRWPGHVPAGSASDAFVLSWDFFPTIAELAGIDPQDRFLEGRSFAGVLDGAILPMLDEPVVWENKFSNDVFSSPSGLLDNYAVRDGPWKLIFDENDVATQPSLFDVSTDQFERNDVAAQHPEIVARLQQVYLDWRLVTGRIGTAFDDAVLDLSAPVRVDDDGRLDTHDGDFTFRAVVNVAGFPDEETAIASKEGAWSLWLTPDGSARLEVNGSDSVRHELRSGVLPAGPIPLAFTVYGRRAAPATVALFVGDESVAELTGPPMIHPGRTPLVVGSPEASGSISGLYLSQTALYSFELAEITRREGA